MPDVSDVTCDHRIVKPRRHQAVLLPVVALNNGTALDENGEVFTEEQIIRTLNNRRATIFATRNGGDFVARCDQFWKTRDTRWNWKATTNERDISPGGVRFAARVSTTVSWFGFRQRGPGSGAYHKALDPIAFYGRRLDDIWPGEGSVLSRLLQWAVALRDWTYESNLELRPTNGAVAAQFLRDKRFYPNPRRKVPRQINQRARENLPGNYYRLYECREGKEYNALYLDQKRSHHFHAQNIDFPHADSLTARGRYLTLDGDPDIPVGDDFVGLYYCRFRTPGDCTYQGQSFLPTNLYADEAYDGWVYSNEIPYLTECGYTFEGAYAAWGGYRRDTGLKRYAAWAEGQLDKYGDPKWIKPILLSTYGVLATRPRPLRFVYGQAKAGYSVKLPTGTESLHGLAVGCTTGRKVEPSFANVLHRGMIEAATRTESLWYAKSLHRLGFTVLSIYADAVVIEDEGNDPPLAQPWRLQNRLTHMQFINTQSFVSSQLTKLPGVVDRNTALKASFGTMGQKVTLRNRPRYAAVTGERID